MKLNLLDQETEAHMINNEIIDKLNFLKNPFSSSNESHTNEFLKAAQSAKFRGTLDYEQTLSTRSSHVGTSDYSSKKIQPRDIWKEYQMNPWDADIVKRLLRVKVIEGKSPAEARIEDYEKMIHICKMRIEDIKEGDLYYREK
jgi:hypothetical protein